MKYQQHTLMKFDPAVGSIWEHRRIGSFYRVTATSVHPETGEAIVEYEHMGANKTVHSRRLSTWHEKFSEMREFCGEPVYAADETDTSVIQG